MHIIKPLPGTLPMPGRLLADAIALWPMNSLGNQIFDLSGNGNDGIITGVPLWQSSRFGSALYTDNDQYVTFTNKLTDYVTDKLSVLWLVEPIAEVSAGHSLQLGQYNNNTSGYDWGFYVRPDSSAIFYIKNAGGVAVSDNFPGTFPVGEVHSLVGVYDGANIEAFRNGVSLGTPAAQTGNVQANWPMQLGFTWAVAERYHNLKTIAVVMWNRALTSSEVALLYREPFCMFPENIMPEFAISA